MDTDDAAVVPGLTGFAKIVSSTSAVAARQGSVSRISGNSGIVFVVNDDEFQPTEVTIGPTSNSWTEIVEGLQPGDVVIADGHQVLEPGDRVDATSLDDDSDSDSGGDSPEQRQVERDLESVALTP